MGQHRAVQIVGQMSIYDVMMKKAAGLPSNGFGQAYKTEHTVYFVTHNPCCNTKT